MSAEAQTPRVAVIGCGHWGKNLVKNFARIGALAAIHDPHPETAGKFADEYDVPAYSWDEILSQDDIDGVVIAAPAELHAKLALEALDAGKHVYVEKPLALTAEDAKAVCDKADKLGKTLMVGHLLQYHPVFVKLRTMVENGDLGTIQYVYSNRMSLGKFRKEENVLWSFAPHDISMILSLAGNDAPSHVSAFGASYMLPGIADTCLVKMAFPSGVHAHIQTSWMNPYKEQKLVVIGDKAMAVFEDTKPWAEKLQLYKHVIDKSVVPFVPQKKDAENVSVPEGEPLESECRHFIEAIAAGTAPRTDGAEGLRVLDVLEKAEASLQACLETTETRPSEEGIRHAI